MGTATADLKTVEYTDPQRHLPSVGYSVDSRVEDGSLDRQVLRVLRILGSVACCGILALFGLGSDLVLAGEIAGTVPDTPVHAEHLVGAVRCGIVDVAPVHVWATHDHFPDLARRHAKRLHVTIVQPKWSLE